MHLYQKPLPEPDTKDVAALYRQYAPALFAYLVQHTLSEENAEDILVEVFLAALQSKPFALLPEKAKIAWLWRVARNKMVDAYRLAKRRSSVPIESMAEKMLDDEASDPVQLALRQEEYERLQKHLKLLSPLQQKVLQLRFRQDMRCADIAAQLGKKEGAIKVMLSRSLNFLRNVYKTGEEEEIDE